MMLKDKVALVTGGAKGIGSAIVDRFLREGASVVFTYLGSAAAADEKVAKLSGSHAVTASRCDVTRAQDIENVLSQVVSKFGRLDILVNNAGLFGMKPLSEITEEFFQQQINANLLGPILTIKAAAPHFPEEGGRIVNISSVASRLSNPGCAVYGASKAGLDVITRTFARELGPRRVTVNAVAPGATDTDMTAWMNGDIRKMVESGTALGRMGRPEDIANVVVFLASKEGEWINGKVIAADGGSSMG